MTQPSEPAAFRLGYVPGVTPGKWARMWAERRPGVPLQLITAPTGDGTDLIRTGAVDAAVLRLPLDRSGLRLIPLYTETTVVVVPKDHLVTAAEDVGIADLADETVLRPADDPLAWPGAPPGRPAGYAPATTAEAIELVAAGVGLLVVPQSLARLHHRRDLSYRPLTDAPGSGVGLAWPDAENTELMEEFIGIVRGRSAHSSRTPRRNADPAPGTPAPARRSGGRRPAARRGGRRR